MHRGRVIPGFDSLCRRHGCDVTLPDGSKTRGLFDCETKAESIAKYESQHLAGTPSIVLKDRLRQGTHLTIDGQPYTVRSVETDPDGALTRHLLKEGIE